MTADASAYEALYEEWRRRAAEAPLTDHERRWALREAIRVMYRHLGLEETDDTEVGTSTEGDLGLELKEEEE